MPLLSTPTLLGDVDMQLHHVLLHALWLCRQLSVLVRAMALMTLKVVSCSSTGCVTWMYWRSFSGSIPSVTGCTTHTCMVTKTRSLLGLQQQGRHQNSCRQESQGQLSCDSLLMCCTVYSLAVTLSRIVSLPNATECTAAVTSVSWFVKCKAA